MKTHRVIGMMSGTSLDGIDLAHCTFEENGDGYSFNLGVCETVPYSGEWLSRLKSLPGASATEYAEAHASYGRYIGGLIKEFMGSNQLTADFVASHGHTIFHNPSQAYTSQLGEGASIAAVCGLPVVCDFRTGDVAAGGQGAPLVPVGDEQLFPQFDYCLNLGGFANISMNYQGIRIAFDIVPANIILNYIANLSGKEFDRNGEMASGGQVNEILLRKLNLLNYYHIPPPKSLGREWVEKEVLPLLNETKISNEDAARTFCEHIAIQISDCLDKNPHSRILVTGGGAFNTFLFQRIQAYTSVYIHIPGDELVNFKEALVFAFLGLLRMQSKPNCLASVTGASHNVSGGAVYLP